MNHGKDICRQLKQLRRDIADQNGIKLEIPECTYEGDCSGTCPRCDYELRYLESELARRQRLGKAAVVAGTVLTMASFQTANAQEPVVMGKPAVIERDVEKKGVLKGIVTEKRTGEPLLSCNVVVKQNGEIIGGARTDFDGHYTIKGLAKGVYDIEFSTTYIGYKKVVLRNYNVKAEGFTICNCELVRDSSLGNKKEVVVKTYTIRGIIDTDKSQPDSTSNRTPVIIIDGDDLPQDGGMGRYTIGGIETQLLDGTPANESGDPQPESPFIPDGSETNPLDNKK
ncbi:MAG: carboxypeptidase regulatory-like domain-containing protein [Bacteroidales bacterium]|nr:carboxypeptidase regulatory-like domain-containing protein [Bacteroidales bacterium]